MQNNVLIEFVKIPVSEALSQFVNEKLEILFNKYPTLIKGQGHVYLHQHKSIIMN